MSVYCVHNYIQDIGVLWLECVCVCVFVCLCVCVCVCCGIVHVQVWWLLSNRCVCIDFSTVVVQK